MKKLLFLLSVFVLSTLSAVSVYAGSWHRDNVGWWVSNGEFALTAEDIEYFNITDTMLQIRGKLYTYDPADYTGDYVGYETQDYMISSYTLYYEKERMLSTGETTKEELLNNYRNGYVNVLMFKVSNGVVREVTIQTKRH